MRNRVIIIVIYLSLFIYLPVYSQYFHHIGAKEGLSQVSVVALYQDKLGRIWMGSQEGLSIYDGQNVATYKPYAPVYNKPDSKILLGNDVASIVGDMEGNIFMTIDRELFKYDLKTESFKNIKDASVSALTSYKGTIWCVANDSILYYGEDDKFHLYKKTNVSGVTCMLVSDKNIIIGSWSGLYLLEPLKSCKLLDSDIRGLYEDSKRNIWIGTQYDGAFILDRKHELKKVPFSSAERQGLNSKSVRTFVEDNSGNIWMGTFDGLQKYDPLSNSFSFYKPQNAPYSLSHTSIFALLRDSQDNIWVGTYYGGVNYFTPSSDLFKRYYYDSANTHCLQYPFVGSMVEDKSGKLWICLDGGGLNCLDVKTGIFTHYKAGRNSLPHNNLKTIAYDEKRNRIYIGTHLGGLCSLDINSGKIHNYIHSSLPNTPGDVIDKIKIWQNSLVITDRSGVFLMDLDNEKFTKIVPHPFRFMDIDNEGIVWAVRSDSLFSFDIRHPESIAKIDIGSHLGITNILATQENDIFVSTLGTGILRYDKKRKKVNKYLYEDNFLISNYCYDMLQTSQGNVLITSDKGITLYSPSQNSSRFIPFTALFMSPMAFGCGAYMCSNNQIYIGSTNGMVSFWEDDLLTLAAHDTSPLYFSKLQVNNKDIHAGDQSKILFNALPYTDELRLSYEQNNFSIFVSRSNYLNVIENSFEYRLKGFDDQWILNSSSIINYTNIPSGNYILQVRPAPNSVASNTEPLSLQIVIYPVWYRTWWAILVFISVFIFSVVSAIHIMRTRRNLTMSLIKEKAEKNNNEIINNAKLRFFTNVSHEFRTPLTLIISQIDVLLQNSPLSPTVYNQIAKIRKHSKRLNSLVTELLDFRKMEQTKLHVSEVDMVDFGKNIYLSYSEYAVQRRIKYVFENNVDCIRVYIDMAQMEKVLFNLLSNAFKYTHDGGEITVSVMNVDDRVQLKVTDNGLGISSSESEKIFERFYQSTHNENIEGTANPGTGIGLALVKNIVELHGGVINLHSEVGKGSAFSILLKHGYSHLVDAGHILEPLQMRKDYIKDTLPAMELIEEYLDIKSNRPKILLVEDNEELLDVLRNIFNSIYHVYTATNGEEAYQKTIDIMPDIIVSDIMMPVMNGIDLCKKIKVRIDLCHIPVVLLTALDTVEQNIDGIRIGADDYITKPFHARMLLVRCNNLIRNRLLLQNRYAKKQDSDVSLLASNALDKKMLEEIVNFIDNHLDKEDFEVLDICRKVGMSKTAFYTKFKSLTNMTPHEFVINHKLKIAANKLKCQSHFTITEIATELGFSSPRYFAQCFKKNFGMAPAEYRKYDFCEKSQ